MMSMKWNEVSLYLTTKGEVIVWAGNEAEICGGWMDEYGRWDDNEIGESQTGRIGLFKFELLSYDKNSDMLKVRRIETPPKL